MKTILPFQFLNKITTLLLFASMGLSAQDLPFNCDFNAYLFQNNDVYAIDLASGNSILVAPNITSGSINGAGYNAKDGFFWGYLTSPDKSIVRIGKNFTTNIYTIPELTTGSKYVGDISPNGIYYFRSSGTTYFKIDLDPASATYLQYLGSATMNQSINIHDWAFNAVDGMLYTVEQATNKLYRVNAETGAVQNLGVVPVLSGNNYTYGAVYFDLSGAFYVSSNQTGTIYVIRDVQNLTGSNAINSNLFAFGPSSSSNDGARCPTAPVPVEICDNGADDDGDGLIDCEDPSCSGYASCPVIEAPTSGGNAGGLESNNRLSEQINKRNFDRVKKAYTFNPATAKRVTKSSKSNQITGKLAALTLKDFMPLGAIKEDEAIESSPTDLLAITNATEVFSVDYLRKSKAVASILAFKTEKGVYEHTKYICDRLLGAQILSISTIDIQDQSFIKSIIKNADGSIEYVLSLSAKPTNNNANFAIESHWNLDKYEKNVPFYNFQIWTNSIDDLYTLGNEVLKLLNNQKTIASYSLSTPPTVFVKKGDYLNGKLDLEIVNTNATKTVSFTAGMRETETSSEIKINSPIDLDKKYISNLVVNTGNLFDIGFRIGDGTATPDDLFLSDGPWGLDTAAASTVVTNYAITPNQVLFDANTFPVERNLSVSATTKEYIAAYRALTPRFKAVNLTSYKSFRLKAKGTGKLEITLVKNSIANWEEQYKTSINLTANYQDFALPFSKFKSSKGTAMEANDIKTIVFKMTATNGEVTTKTMNLESIRFSKEEVFLIEDSANFDPEMLTITPNPVADQAVIDFYLKTPEKVTISIYTILGKTVKEFEMDAQDGQNRVYFSKENLESGIYFCKINSQQSNLKAAKLMIK
ncbi:MAG: hypothetical protein QG594_2586 [Bacteroidota bacterium]|nr:hypothetical protein [Bacteroidota bacterium]